VAVLTDLDLETRCGVRRTLGSWRKKAALNRPIGWASESTSSRSFAGSTMARSALGLFKRPVLTGVPPAHVLDA
jgi:hypothetical protein